MFSFALAAYNLVRMRNLGPHQHESSGKQRPAGSATGRSPSNRGPRAHLLTFTANRNSNCQGNSPQIPIFPQPARLSVGQAPVSSSPGLIAEPMSARSSWPFLRINPGKLCLITLAALANLLTAASDGDERQGCYTNIDYSVSVHCGNGALQSPLLRLFFRLKTGSRSEGKHSMQHNCFAERPTKSKNLLVRLVGDHATSKF